jgi:hypothetical protein
MAGNRYDRGWTDARGYGRQYGPRRGRYDAGMRAGYDTQLRGGYDREWTEGMAYGREPGMERPGTFAPFGWDPMMRWAGWDPLMGFVPYQDSPRQWSYGLADDYRRYEHDYYRGNTTGGYGRDYRRAGGYDQAVRGYDRDVRGWPRRPRR